MRSPGTASLISVRCPCPRPYTKGVHSICERCRSMAKTLSGSAFAMPIDRRTRWALRGISLLRQSIESSDLRRCTLSCAHSALPHNPLRRTAVDLPKGNFRLSLSTAVARSLACPTDRTTGALCRATWICAMTTYRLGFRTAWNLPAVDPRDSLALRLGCGRERRCAEWIQRRAGSRP